MIDGAVKFDEMIERFKVKFVGTLQWTVDEWVSFLAKGEEERRRFQYCMNPLSSDKFVYFRAIQGHSGGNLVDPFLQDNALLPDDFTEYIYHIRNAFGMHSIIEKWTDPSRKRPQKGQAVNVLRSLEPDVCSTRSERS